MPTIMTTPASATEPAIDLSSVWKLMMSRPLLLVAPILIALALAAAFLAVTPSRYRSTVIIAVDPKADGTFSGRTAASDGHADSAIVESELEILRSPEVARAVVIAQGDGLERALLPVAAHTGDNRLAGLFALLGRSPPSPHLRLERATESLRRRVDVSRIRSTHVLTITADMPNPQLAAAVANDYANAYLAARTTAQRETSAHASTLMRARVEDLHQQAISAEMAVENARVSAAPGDRDVASAKVRLRTLESTARTYRALHDKLLEDYAQTHLASLAVLPRARVVSAAREPLSHYWPRPSIVIGAALVIGLALGVLTLMTLGRPSRSSNE